MKRILAATTILAAIGSPAFATGYNDLFIDAQGSGASTGSVTTLSVTQDASGGSNLVNATGGSSSTAKFPVRGAWKAITINQTGSGNTLYGGIKTASVNGTTNAVLNANYTSTGGGKNTHSLNVGSTAAPTDPTINVYVTNGGTGTNAITDTLNSGASDSGAYTGGALTYNLTIAAGGAGTSGTGNSVTNNVTAANAITLNQGTATGVTGGYGIFGDNNTVNNEVSGVTTFTHDLTVNGSSNQITNTANLSSTVTDASIMQNIGSDSNKVQTTIEASASGTQMTSLTVSGLSKVDYVSDAAGANQSSTIVLDNVIGASNGAAQVVIQQTASAGGASVNLNVEGGSYTTGTLGALTGTVATGYTPAVSVYQNSTNATAVAYVAAAANGYTVSIKQ